MKEYKSENVPQSIYSCLKDDHKEIKRLCREILDEESGDAASAQTNFEELMVLVSSHAKSEESTFYPLLQEKALMSENERLHDLVLEAFEEHHMVDLLLKEIKALEPSDERWMAKMTVLQELLNHHIKEEEESMFSNAREELDVAETKTVGADFLDRQTEMSAL